jgi:hypothetical protein
VIKLSMIQTCVTDRWDKQLCWDSRGSMSPKHGRVWRRFAGSIPSPGGGGDIKRRAPLTRRPSNDGRHPLPSGEGFGKHVPLLRASTALMGREYIVPKEIGDQAASR